MLLVGLIVLCRTQRQRLGKALLVLGTVFFLGAGWSPIADRLLDPFERRHDPLRTVEGLSHIRHVVVLGGGHESDGRLPHTGRLSDASQARLIEGIRLHRLLPESVLVFTGGAIFDPVPHAKVMADAAMELGVDPERIVVFTQSWDTAEEALELRKNLGAEVDFILVTSASHMPRAVLLARAAGLAPIAAPADFLVKDAEGQFSPGELFPSASALRRTERAIYEAMGLIWANLHELPRLRRATAGE
ncbi:envelope biogenesis factor ElyC [Desulfonatronum parangueonense]